jgi:rhodanese-related sulfurtransferase
MPSPHEEPFTHVSPQEALTLVSRGAAFLDVREPEEYREAHAEGTTLMPVNTIFTNPAQIPADQDVVFICKSGARSAMAAEMAAASGRAKGKLYNVDGGTDAWLAAGLPRA